jgi:hypothetical protein
MRRALLCCVGCVLGLAAEAILWNAHDLYAFADSWHSAALTRTVGVGVIVEGALLAFGASLCLGRALRPWAPAPGPAAGAVGGGPVLPVCGLLFLLAAVGPFEQARFDAEVLEVTDSMPGHWGPDIVEADRRHLRTDWAFGVLWLVVGGLLLGTPLFLKPRVWQLGWRTNGVGWAVAACGFLLSGLGACVCLANGLTGEGASAELSFVGYFGVLAGAAAAVGGSAVAVLGKAKP